MIRLFNFTASFLFLFFITINQVYAESNYVLPYPSSMPSSTAYKFHLLFEAISKYWYFGDFGEFDYNLKMADKYLVEAKTLFEYRQYLLAYKALKKSDQYFINIRPNLAKAEKNGKNIFQKKAILNAASQKHLEILIEIENSTPDIFLWQPEKLTPTNLNLKKTIDESMRFREKGL